MSTFPRTFLSMFLIVIKVGNNTNDDNDNAINNDDNYEKDTATTKQYQNN